MFFDGWEPRQIEIFMDLYEKNDGKDMESVCDGLINAVGLLRVAQQTASVYQKELSTAQRRNNAVSLES